jgi:acetyltransferase-like isoleucine patch superfamily enzyme
MFKTLGKLYLLIKKLKTRFLRYLLSPLFAEHGDRFTFFPADQFSYETIHVGNDVYIGPGALISGVKAIRIGNNVLIGPNVMVIGGDHNMELNGKPMTKIDFKREGDDQPILIEDDVWVGAGSIILKGVTIGRGAIVAAGSVVSRDVLPYTVVGGCPARKIKDRGTIEQILMHESNCYAESDRLSELILRHPNN